MYHPNPDNFVISELVPPEEVTRWGEGAIMLINPLAAISLQQIRNRHGRMRLNSKRLNFTQRGFRTEKMWKPKKGLTGMKAELDRLQRFAANRSAHLRGDAFDADMLDTTVEAVIEDIRENPDLYPFIHFVEVGQSWLHFDVRNQSGITFWHPEKGIVDFVEQCEINWSLIAPGI